MRRALLLLAGAALSSPALAQQQHHGHGEHPHHAPPPPPSEDPHAHHHGDEAPPAEDPHAHHHGHEAPPAEDPHAHHRGHEAPRAADPQAHHHGQDADPHAGHAGHEGHGAEMRNPPRPPVAPPPPGAFSGPAHAADLVFGEERMAPVRAHIVREHGGMLTHRFLLDRLEARLGRGHEAYAWDAQFWYGGDVDKLWLKSEGEGEFGGHLESFELQALWSRAIDPWFDVQLGVRQDVRPRPNRTHAVLGVQGLAPYWFEVEAMLFLSHKGELSARLEAEYDLRITQQLILQPSVELDLALEDARDIGVGSGLSSAEFGARLRYEFRPEFAPYAGVHYERAFGRTARFARAAGEEPGGWSFVLGVRTWF
jgi:copper resistance protein B